MSKFSPQDHTFMQLAIELAKQGRFTTSPNPCVGCVIVKKGEIVGKGFHFRAGEPHAEVMALREAGERAKGATAYVTLEPCAHFGRTPPCALGLINAGVSKVIAAMQDPNPQVAGKGLAMLAEAGIETAVGLLEQEAENLNKGFLHRMRTGRPFVQLKLGMSLDGRTAMANGESKWITGDEARADVQQERAKASAVLSTSATVLADNPSLNVRWEQFSDEIQQIYMKEDVRQPVRVILDFQHKIQPKQGIFSIPSAIWLVSDKPRDLADFPEFVEQMIIETYEEQTALSALMQALGKRQINSLWVEAGATLAGALIEENLVDELILYVAPKLLGNDARGLCKLPHLNRLTDAPQWVLQEVLHIGEDLKMRYIRKKNA
ncbi:MAG: bifunctional diaminohydroxyphosphoribosylaminopyrimidine deaminase/5-amino-6-(5-phosphoribosylamino)uracil reductase RibD [Lonepinella koalarum]|nr:bifunctional diaminohydroxyphosphoribosylaminopyrimidine deaminase/5-amino-6-(5-phosphoribosylamino)uracil reductase RibD [Lonepinella koalarum]